MYQRLIALLAVLGACAAQAAENPQSPASSTSADASAKPALRRLPAPTMSVMRVTRQPDGTLATDCVQRPNPKAHPQKQGAQP